MKIKVEKNHLENIAKDSWYCRGVNRNTIEYSFKIFSRHLQGKYTLEMGPAEGVMTSLLAEVCEDLTLVEGAAAFCDDLQRRFPMAKVNNCLFEEYSPNHEFDNIVLGHVLEHVDDPVDVLKHAKQWLTPNGQILAAVPNSRSLHRQAAVVMGLLPFEESLNESDIHHGHRRIFNPETFRGAFLSAGLSIKVYGGYWLKPVSNKQIEKSWTPAMLEAFMSLGERYPDIAGELYVIASN